LPSDGNWALDLELMIEEINVDLTTDVLNQLLVVQIAFIKVGCDCVIFIVLILLGVEKPSNFAVIIILITFCAPALQFRQICCIAILVTRLFIKDC